MDVLHLLDQVALQGVPAGGVHYADVVLFGRLQTRLGHGGGVGVAPLAVKEDALLLAEGFELVEGSGPEGVGADDRRPEALSLEEGSQLGGSGGLARPLQADQHDVLLFEGDVRAAAHQVDQLLIDDVYDVLPRIHPRRGLFVQSPLLDGVGELHHQLYIDIRLQEGPLDLPHRIVHQGLVDLIR